MRRTNRVHSLCVYIVLILSLLHYQCTHKLKHDGCHNTTINPSLSDPFFETTLWSYPEFTIKNEDGSFQFTDGSGDTSHIIHHAHIIIADDESKELYFGQDILRYGYYQWQHDTLCLVIEDWTVSIGHTLRLRMIGNCSTADFMVSAPALPSPNTYFVKDLKLSLKTIPDTAQPIQGHISARLDFPGTPLTLNGYFNLPPK